MDICLMAHPAPVKGLIKMLAVSEIEVEFIGKGAHAAGAPWEGINALESVVLCFEVWLTGISAAVSAYNSLSMLRQQTLPTSRMHGILRTAPGAATNIIPE
jgi:metal-dependent amidase/aminoacylase/carboxypeptidase family protein